MSKPTLTAAESDAVEASKGIADAGVEGADLQIAALTSLVDNHQLTEDAVKKFFDFHNDDIIRQYELERRFLNGKDIADPIAEADLIAFVDADDSIRIWNGGDRTPLRIDEFDGTPLVTIDDVNEADQFTNQSTILGRLQSGISGQVLLAGTATNTTTVDINATTMQITSNSVETFGLNDKLLIENGTDAAVVTVTSAPVETGGLPPFLYDFNISIDLLQVGDSIGSGADTGQSTFTGFDNTERTNKTAVPDWRQGFLDELLDQLETSLTTRQTALNNEKTALQANLSDTLGSTPITELDTSLTAVEDFLGATPPSTIDISDTGITAFNNEDTLRSAQITSRLTDIDSELVTEDSFNLRFDFTVTRVDLGNGTLKVLTVLEDSITSSGEGKTAAEDLSSRFTEILA